MSYTRLLIFPTLLLVLATMAPALAQTTATGFLDQSVDVNGKAQRYALYVPDNYDPAKKWPLIVFLHGSGERGDDNLLQTEVGLPSAIRLHRDWFPALVLIPQCPDKKFWDVAVPTIEAAMAQTQADYSVDEKAITLTGLSLGGYATWIWGALKTDTFAALMPVCGGGDIAHVMGELSPEEAQVYGTMEDRVKKLATIPIWAFHGKDDDVVLPARSQEMVDRVKKAGGDVRYKEWKDTGHNSWDATYGHKRAMAWLLKQRKK